MLADFGKLAQSPACTLTVRPIVKRQLMNCDTKRLITSVTQHLVRDVAKGLDVNPHRLSVSHAPDPKATAMMKGAGGGEDMGLSLLSEAGACDFILSFAHEDGCDDDDMPFELLKRAEDGLTSGELALTTVCFRGCTQCPAFFAQQPSFLHSTRHRVHC